jgi:hypothetical protein
MVWIIIMNVIIAQSYSYNNQNANEDLPELNKKIVEYVESVIGTEVDRGECWDLAANALEYANADWDGMYEFGEEYIFKNKPILPGDILQFKNVIANYSEGYTTFTEKFMHHTAIVYKVHDNNLLEIAHQNTGLEKNMVVITDFNPEWITKGKLRYYRPVQ